MKMFDQPNARLERRIIQSAPFRKVVTANWADWCLKEDKLMDTAGIHKLIELCPVNKQLQSEEITWMLDRIMKGPAELNSELSPFPSVLSRSGPQFPFTYSEFDHLRKRAGSLKGTEMTKPIEVVPRPVDRLKRKKTRAEDLAVYKWKVADDDDLFEEDPLKPKSTAFFPNRL